MLDAGEVDMAAAQLEIEHYWAGALRRAVIDGDVEGGSLMAGQSVGMVSREESVAEIIASFGATGRRGVACSGLKPHDRAVGEKIMTVSRKIIAAGLLASVAACSPKKPPAPPPAPPPVAIVIPPRPLPPATRRTADPAGPRDGRAFRREQRRLRRPRLLAAQDRAQRRGDRLSRHRRGDARLRL